MNKSNRYPRGQLNVSKSIARDGEFTGRIFTFNARAKIMKMGKKISQACSPIPPTRQRLSIALGFVTNADASCAEVFNVWEFNTMLPIHTSIRLPGGVGGGSEDKAAPRAELLILRG